MSELLKSKSKLFKVLTDLSWLVAQISMRTNWLAHITQTKIFLCSIASFIKLISIGKFQNSIQLKESFNNTITFIPGLSYYFSALVNHIIRKPNELNRYLTNFLVNISKIFTHYSRSSRLLIITHDGHSMVTFVTKIWEFFTFNWSQLLQQTSYQSFRGWCTKYLGWSIHSNPPPKLTSVKVKHSVYVTPGDVCDFARKWVLPLNRYKAQFLWSVIEFLSTFIYLMDDILLNTLPFSTWKSILPCNFIDSFVV